jgi:hypothetical protein
VHLLAGATRYNLVEAGACCERYICIQLAKESGCAKHRPGHIRLNLTPHHRHHMMTNDVPCMCV